MIPSIAISHAKEKLYLHGKLVEQENWQSVKSPDDTIELLHHTVKFEIPTKEGHLVSEIRPNMDWALNQFNERVGGNPLNPGETYKEWPHFKNHSNELHRTDRLFSHTYMERFWPKQANKSGITNMGIRYGYGDLGDLVKLLRNDPTTRQAYLPVYFPEDTGTHHGGRVPCTLGYRFIMRNDTLDITYDIRSCDIIRHFRDDIYMACKLVFWVIEKCGWNGIVTPGRFIMNITSLHCFKNEKELLRILKT